MQSVEQKTRVSGTVQFLLILAGLFLLRLLIDSVQIQNKAVAAVLQILATAIFLCAPIIGLFFASRDSWSAKKGFGFLLAGIALHAGGVLISGAMGKEPSFGKVLLESIGQTGLTVWCAGLGALVATLIKDKNLILPISIFLAGFDAFLIFNPSSLPQQIMQKSPEVFKAVAYKVPTFGFGPVAQVGPADIFFLGMFFVAIHKFGMRSKETLRWILPVLLGYLFVVLFLGGVSIGPISLGALPALVPIGLTILLVNRKEFALTKDEKAATWAVAVMAIGLAGFGIFRAQQVANMPPVKVEQK